MRRNAIPLVALLAAALVGCRGTAPVAAADCRGAPAPARDTIVLGAVPDGDPATRKAELAPLAKLLERRLGVPVELEVAASHQATARALAQGRWDVALLGPVLYSRAHESGYEAVAMPSHAGSTVFSGMLIARPGGPARLEDLRGKRIAFVDPSSASGFQYPFALLFAHGLRPGDYAHAFVGSHLEVVRAVLDGRFDAGACHSDTLNDLFGAGPHPQALVLGHTDPVPGDVFAVRHASPRYQALRDALLAIPGEPDAQGVLRPMRADGIVPADENAFESAHRIDLLVSEQSGL